MPDAVIVSALRTPIGTAMKGTLRDTDAYQLAEHVVGAAAADLDSVQIDDVILGEGLYGGGVVARHAAITAGLTSVPGLALNRHCAAGQAAVQSAAASIRAGMDQLIIAGGVNSASTSPRFKRRAGSQKDGEMVDWFPPTHPDRPDAPNMDMSITVGWNAAVKAGVSREEMDEWALGSHRKAIQAIDEGRFKHEIVPIETPHGLFETDEHPRRDTSIEKLAALKPLHPEIEGFSITAGNACGANDGAAVLTIASDRLGLPALATIRSWASVGVDPAFTGLAPVEAIPKALARARLSLADVDLFEINEAFASMCVATIKLLDLDPEQGQRQRQRLLARPSGRRHRCADARHARARTAQTRRRNRGGSDVCRRRNGIGHRHRGPGSVNFESMTIDELISAAQNGSTRAAGKLLSLVESPRRNEVLDALGRDNAAPHCRRDRPTGRGEVDDRRCAGRVLTASATCGWRCSPSTRRRRTAGERCWATGSEWPRISTTPTCSSARSRPAVTSVGLAAAVPAAIRLLAALSYDLIVLETVGVGQSEIEIAAVADPTVVILNPGAGDAVQAAKAGLLEVADIVVVNKADRDGADQTVRDLRAETKAPILKLVAAQGEGIAELVEAIDEFHRADTPERRAARARAQILSLAQTQLRNHPEVDRLAEAVAEGRCDPYTAAEQLFAVPAEE